MTGHFVVVNNSSATVSAFTSKYSYPKGTDAWQRIPPGASRTWTRDDWEVIAPPFVETEEVPWYRWCLNWMRGGIKGIKQVLAFRPSYRTVPSGYHQTQEKVFPFYSFYRDHCFIISTIPALVVSLAENQAFSVKSLGPYRTCVGGSVFSIDSWGDRPP